MNTKILFSAMVISSFVAISAHAEGSGAHGGNAVDCPGKPLVVLDYYNAKERKKSGAKELPKLVKLDGLSRQDTLDLLLGRLPWAFRNQIDAVMGLLKTPEDWYEGNLESVKDTNLVYSIPGCTLPVAAVRQGKEMSIDPAIKARLDEPQIAILNLHEAFYYFGETHANLQTSEKIRTLMRELLMAEIDYKALEGAIRDIGGRVAYSPQLLVGNAYKVKTGSGFPDGLERHLDTLGCLKREFTSATPELPIQLKAVTSECYPIEGPAPTQLDFVCDLNEAVGTLCKRADWLSISGPYGIRHDWSKDLTKPMEVLDHEGRTFMEYVGNGGQVLFERINK